MLKTESEALIMATTGFKTFSKSFKYVDKAYGLLRTGKAGPSISGYWPNPASENYTYRFDRSRSHSLSASSCHSYFGLGLEPSLLKGVSDLPCKNDNFQTRDFMKLSRVTSSPNLTPAIDSGATFYFDTHKLVTTLQSHGFSLDQAETITDCLTEILTNGASGMSKYMVSIYIHFLCVSIYIYIIHIYIQDPFIFTDIIYFYQILPAFL